MKAQTSLVVCKASQAVSRRGNCHDNAVAESFFTLLKRERIRRRTHKARAHARQDVFGYIEMFYNTKRKHMSNRMLPPVGFERQQEMSTEGGPENARLFRDTKCQPFRNRLAGTF